MRIENHLNDSENAAKLQGSEDFRKRICAIGNLPKNRHQHRAIKVILREHSIAKRSGNEVNVLKPRRFRFRFSPSKHSRLKIQRDDAPRFTNTSTERNRHTPGATPRIQNPHAGR